MIEFELPDFAEITPDGKRLLLEKTIRHKGVWRIHKSDSDDIFPSDPHADRQDKPEKLDLYTGNVYSKSTKKFIYQLPAKAMKYIYNQIMNCNEDTIKQKLITKKDSISYL